MRAPASLFGRDFDELEGGESFATAGRTITETDVISFAGLTGDMHPQHVDAEWAGRSAFGERVAHGMLVASYAVGLTPFDPERIVALRRIGDAVFKQPARVGDTIHVEGRVDRVDAIDDDLGLVGCAFKVVNQRGQTVLRMKIDVLWRRGGQVPDSGVALGAALPGATPDALA